MPEVRQKKKANRRPLTKPTEKEKKDQAPEKKMAAKLEERAKEEGRAKAQEFKEQGNEAFAAKDYLRALELFTSAIAEDMTDHVFYSNRSAVNLALKRTTDAVADAQGCVDIKPDWPKGYSRLGAALWADTQLEKALAAYAKGLELDGENEAMKQSKAAVEAELKRQQAEAAQAAQAAAAQSEPQGPVEPVIGIDLGTTYSAVAVWDEALGGVRILADESGNRTTASVVGWSPDGERLVGERAKAQAAKCPARTLFDVKRILGRRTHEDAVKAEQKLLPYAIVAGEDSKPVIEVPLADGTKRFAPEEVSAMVLRRMKEIAEKELGRELTKAVVTVPAYFNDEQRRATQAAGLIAGLEVLRVINEPTAAALGYSLDQKAGSAGSNVLIFDLGGGTFDVSMLRIEGGVLEVKATGGDTRCGGEDLDHALVAHMLEALKAKGVADPDALRGKLKRTAEAVKRDLSSNDRVEVDLEELGAGDGSLSITRELFEKLNKAFFDRVFATVESVCKDAKVTAREVDEIVLVGGSTRVPLIQQRLLKWGGKALCKSINPDEAVAYGAAVQGAILSGVRTAACQDMVLIDVTPLSLGIQTDPGRHHSIIIPRNTPIPCTKHQTYTTTENYAETEDVIVFEGERTCTDQNHLLGEFKIHGIERAKKGEPQIEVTFALDANGMLTVTAQDQKTKAKAECTINNACKSLSKEEIERMLVEAGKMAESDADFRRKVVLRTELESLAYELDDEEKRDALLEWLDALDLSATSLSALETRLSKAQREAA